MKFTEWPRVPITIPPAPTGLPIEETEQALLAVCQNLWAASKVPVVVAHGEVNSMARNSSPRQVSERLNLTPAESSSKTLDLRR